MASFQKPPTPSFPGPAEFLQLIDPETGQPIRVADLRAEFERLSGLVPRDPEAERAFIEGKLNIIRNDPNLTDAEKERAIEELRRRLENGA
jgi:hypothetical protein